MRYHPFTLHGYRILLVIYLLENLLLIVFFIAFPLVIVGPSLPLSAFQLWIGMLIFYAIKVLSSVLLLEGKIHVLIILLLVLACLWEIWLASPFFWKNPGTVLLLLDWTVLISTIHMFWNKK